MNYLAFHSAPDGAAAFVLLDVGLGGGFDRSAEFAVDLLLQIIASLVYVAADKSGVGGAPFGVFSARLDGVQNDIRSESAGAAYLPGCVGHLRDHAPMQCRAFRIEELQKVLVDVGPERIRSMTEFRDMRANPAGKRRAFSPGKRVAIEVRKLGQQSDAGRIQGNARAVADLPETAERERPAFHGAAEIREYGPGLVRPLWAGKRPLVKRIVGPYFVQFFVGVVVRCVFSDEVFSFLTCVFIEICDQAEGVKSV